MVRWRASCSGSPAASRPTRPASSCACSSRRATTCCRCRPAAPSASSAPETFFALARKSPSADPYPHLERADLLVIAPLTANTLAKLAHGLADDVLTEAALAHRGPVLVAPAMNTRMWEHEATQANAATLRSRGVELIGPEAGELAEGEVGAGRMSEPEAIARADRGAARTRRARLARGHARARQRGRHTRAARRGAFPRQPLLGPDGRRGRRRGPPPRRAGDAARREPRRARARTASRSCRRRRPPISSARRGTGPAPPT